jgi:hypothetical protein
MKGYKDVPTQISCDTYITSSAYNVIERLWWNHAHSHSCGPDSNDSDGGTYRHSHGSGTHGYSYDGGSD